MIDPFSGGNGGKARRVPLHTRKGRMAFYGLLQLHAPYSALGGFLIMPFEGGLVAVKGTGP